MGSTATKGLNITLIDQGVNGGTVTDLVAGFSPWGHLDPHVKQSNISFAQVVCCQDSHMHTFVRRDDQT